MKRQLKYLWGRLLDFFGQKEKARDIFNAVDEGTDLQIKQSLVQINNSLGDLEAVLEHLREMEELVSERDRYKRILESKIDTLLKLDRHEEALEILQEEDQEDPDILGMTAAVASGMEGKTGVAQKYAERVLEQEPEDAKAHFILGGVEYQRENYQQALEHYQKIWEQDFSPKIALGGLIACYLELDELEKAEEYLEKLESDYEQHLTTYFNRARLEYKSGNLEESYEILQELKPHVEEANISGDVFFDFYKQVRDEISE